MLQKQSGVILWLCAVGNSLKTVIVCLSRLNFNEQLLLINACYGIPYGNRRGCDISACHIAFYNGWSYNVCCSTCIYFATIRYHFINLKVQIINVCDL